MPGLFINYFFFCNFTSCVHFNLGYANFNSNSKFPSDYSHHTVSDRNESPVPAVACTLDENSSPIVKSNLLQFEYTSPQYPTSIDETSSGLCVLRIDHNWKFGPRGNSTVTNDTSSDSDEDKYSESSTSDESFFEELCNPNSQTSSGGEGGGVGGTSSGGGGVEGTTNQEPPKRIKPKICQVSIMQTLKNLCMTLYIIKCRYLDIYWAYFTITFLGSTRLLGFQVAAPNPRRLPI